MAPTELSFSLAFGGVASQALAKPKSVMRNWQSLVTSKLPAGENDENFMRRGEEGVRSKQEGIFEDR